MKTRQTQQDFEVRTKGSGVTFVTKHVKTSWTGAKKDALLLF